MGLLDFINPLKPLTDAANQAFQAYLNAQNDEAKRKAEAEMAYWKDRIAASSAAGRDPWYSPRAIMGYCAALYVAKLIAWDTVFRLGVTPNPGEQVTLIVMTIVGFYFASRAAEVVAEKIAGAIGRR